MQILGGETERGVFVKLQVFAMSGRNQVQKSDLKSPADKVCLF